MVRTRSDFGIRPITSLGHLYTYTRARAHRINTMGHMGQIEKQDGPANGFMREAMPVVSAWIDDLRLAFGRDDVTRWVREGLADGTFYAAENGHEIGVLAPAPENAISLAEMVIAAPQPKDKR